jgi:hypothetical protein
MALTVIMDSAADADACSTGLFVAGRETHPDPAAWEIQAMIAIAPGARQDEVQIESIGEVPWVTDDEGADGRVSREGS